MDQILLNQALDSTDQDVVTMLRYTAAGQVKEQYRAKLAEYGRTMNLTLAENKFAYPYYDATWAFAVGLYCALMRPDFRSFSVLHSEILNFRFQGVSSWIHFNNRRQVSNPVTLL